MILFQDGLVRNNMEKLTFYALSSPEKLDRIGEYLALRVSRDISRHRLKYVEISMEAMDQLLVACHAQSLNLFVESFLKMVQRLLECQNPDLQLLATQSVCAIHMNCQQLTLHCVLVYLLTHV